MPYYEYNRNGSTLRSRRSSQQATRIVLTETVVDVELDGLKDQLIDKLGNDGYFSWYCALPYNVQCIRRLWVGAMRTKLAELADAPASQ